MPKAEPSDLNLKESVSDRFLTFFVARRRYALPADKITEVILIPTLARVPEAPAALLGLANLRGAVLPFASLRALLRMEAADKGASSRAIVLDHGAPVALVVDAVDALVTVKRERVATEPAELSAETGEVLTGAFALDGSGVVTKILDVQTLLTAAFAQRARARPHLARRDSTLGGNSQAPQEGRALATFDVAGHEFALPLDAIHEIFSLPLAIVALPRTETPVLGVAAFRDQLLPLLSLRGLLGFAPSSTSDAREKVVVVSVRGSLVGLVADGARAIIYAHARNLEPMPRALAARMGGEARATAVFRGDDGRRIIPILSLDQLFREDVMQRLGSTEPLQQSESRLDAGREERTFVVFRLGHDEFGIPVEAVDEVARVPDKITRVPNTPEFLEGIVNIRGEVLPVVDQRRRFDMPKLEQGNNRRLIVVRTGRHRAGLIVDTVSEVLRTTSDLIEPAPDLTDSITRLVQGVVNVGPEGRMILLLDPDELLTRAERGLIDKLK